MRPLPESHPERSSSHGCLGPLEIEDYAFEYVSEAARQRIEEHLIACPRCCRQVSDELDLRDAFRLVLSETELGRRREPRRVRLGGASFTTATGRPVIAVSLDVSPRGACVLAGLPLDKGEAVLLTIGAFTGPAIVRYCLPSDGEYRLGFEYTGARTAELAAPRTAAQQAPR